MRSAVSHASAEQVDPQAGEPPPGEAVVVPAVASVLDAGEDCQALVDVAVDLGELPRGVAVAEVGTPAAQHAVEAGHYPGDGMAHQASAGRLPDSGPELRHGAVRRPALQVPAAPPPP